MSRKPAKPKASVSKRKKRPQRPFPASTFEDALDIAKEIYNMGADLSFHNPNVFYELAIRHAARLPVVQIIRRGDRIPFDLNQIRTIRIDNTDIYSLVPRIETYKSEIASQVRRAIENPDLVDNPITTFYGNYRLMKEASPRGS